MLRIACSVLLLSAVGCGGSSSEGGVTGGAGGTAGSGGSFACDVDQAGVLGIHIDFAPNVECRYSLAEAAAGVSIPYSVVVGADVSDVVVQSQSSCGEPGPSGLIVFERLSGNGQSYCLCDTGLCPAPSDTPVTIPAGTHDHAFAWDGKNWSGPSDTGNPKGAAFPPGSYTLEVSAKGKQGNTQFDVRSTLAIEITP